MEFLPEQGMILTWFNAPFWGDKRDQKQEIP